MKKDGVIIKIEPPDPDKLRAAVEADRVQARQEMEEFHKFVTAYLDDVLDYLEKEIEKNEL